MQRFARSFTVALRGPAGGMLACILLAAMLGGIAMANPDALRGGNETGAPRGGASHGGGTAIPEAHGDERAAGHEREPGDPEACGGPGGATPTP